MDAQKIFEFLKKIDSDTLVVIDGAYMEYAIAKDAKKEIVVKELIEQFDNVIYLGTFSKAYGMAGIRIGFGLTHNDISDLINRVRQPFNINSIGLAGAVAALRDTEFVRRSCALNQAGMLQIITGLRHLGIEYIPSYGNFLSFCVKRGDAAPVYQNLLKQGIIVRPIGVYEMPRHLRVTIGLESENEKFLQALQNIV